MTITSGAVDARAFGPLRGDRLAGTLPAKTISPRVVPGGKLRPGRHQARLLHGRPNFAAKVGQKIDLEIDNTDEGEHSITSPEIGVNIIVKPGIHTYEIVVKEKGPLLMVLRDPLRRPSERLGDAARRLHERLHHGHLSAGVMA